MNKLLFLLAFLIPFTVSQAREYPGDEDMPILTTVQEVCVHYSAIAYRVAWAKIKFNMTWEDHERELDREFGAENQRRDMREEVFQNIIGKRQVNAVAKWVYYPEKRITEEGKALGHPNTAEEYANGYMAECMWRNQARHEREYNKKLKERAERERLKEKQRKQAPTFDI